MPSQSTGRNAVAGPALLPQGEHAGKPPIPLTRPVTVVGSRNNCRIHLMSSTVSKAHCLLVLTDTGCYVADLASRTHTIVNGKPAREADLRDGDSLKIGRFVFRFVAGRTREASRYPKAAAGSLEVTGGPVPVPIERRVTLIGRRRTADIPLLEETVSTAHAVLLERDGKRYVRDLGSRTGTFLNGRQVHQEEVRPGDTLRIGETDLAYRLDESVTLLEDEPEEKTPRRARAASPVAPPVVADREPRETLALDEADEPSEDLKLDLPPLIQDEPPAPHPHAPQADAPPEPPAVNANADTAIPLEIDLPTEPATEAVPDEPLAQIEEEPAEPLADATTPSAGASETLSITPADLDTPVLEPPPPAVVDEDESFTSRRGWRGVGDDAAASDEPSDATEPTAAAVVEPAPPADALDATAWAEPVELVEPVEPARPVEPAGPAIPLDLLEPPAPLVAPTPDAPDEPAVAEVASPAPSEATDEPVATTWVEPVPFEPIVLESEPPAAAWSSPLVEAAPALPELDLSTPLADDTSEDLAPPPVESPIESADVAVAPIELSDALTNPSIEIADEDDEPAAEVEPRFNLVEPAHELIDLDDETPARDDAGPLLSIELPPAPAAPVAEEIDEDEDIVVEATAVLPADEPDETPVAGVESLPASPAIDEAVASDSPAGVSLEAAAPEGDVIEPTEPEPASALADPVTLGDDERTGIEVIEPVRGEASLSDSVFAREVEAISPGGEVVETPPLIDLPSTPADTIRGDDDHPLLEPGDLSAAPEPLPHLAEAEWDAAETTPPDGATAPGVAPAAATDDLAAARAEADGSASERAAALLADHPLARTPGDATPTTPPDESVEPTRPPMAADSTLTPEPPGEAAPPRPAADASPEEPIVAPTPPRPQRARPAAAVDVFSLGADADGFLGGGGAVELPPVRSPFASRSLVETSDADAARRRVEGMQEPILPASAEASPPTEGEPAAPIGGRDDAGDVAAAPIDEPPPTPEPAAEQNGSSPLRPADRRRERGSVRRRRSLRNDAASVPADGIAPPADAEPPATETRDSPALPEAAAVLESPADERPAPRPRPTPRPVPPMFDVAALPFANRPLDPAVLSGRVSPSSHADPDDAAHAAQAALARRRTLRRIPALLALMAVLIGGAVAAIYALVPVTGRVDVAVRFRNLDGLPNETQRREFRDLQKQRLGSAVVRQQAVANLAAERGADGAVPPGFLGSEEQYDPVALAASWVERNDWQLKLVRESRDTAADRWRLKAMATALYQSNQSLVDDARRLRSEVEKLDADIVRESARVAELRQLIDTERTAGEGLRQHQGSLAKIDSDLALLQSRWTEATGRVRALQGQLEQLRSQPPATPLEGQAAPADANASPADDSELAALQKQMDELQQQQAQRRQAQARAAEEARRAFDAAVGTFQSDLTDVQSMLQASPELKAYVDSAQFLLDSTRKLTEDLIHRQQQQYERLQGFKRRLEESMQTRRVQQWQNDPELKDLNEQLAYAQRQLNVATANNLSADASDARMQIKLLEERIAKRQASFGHDELAVQAVTQLQEIIDYTARAMAEDRQRQEQTFEESTRTLKKAAIEKLPAEQKELAAKLEQRMTEIRDARQQFAAVLAGDASAPATEPDELATRQAELVARIEHRRKVLAAASTEQLTQQQHDQRRAEIDTLQKDLSLAQEQVSQLQDRLLLLQRDRLSAAKRVGEASVAGERIVQRQAELERLEQSLEIWKRTLNAKKSELASSIEPMPVSDMDVNVDPGHDRRWLFALAASMALFALFGTWIATMVRSASAELPAAPLRPVPLATLPTRGNASKPQDEPDAEDTPTAVA